MILSLIHIYSEISVSSGRPESSVKAAYLQKKQASAELRRLRANLRNTENEIGELEKQIEEIQSDMLKPENYSSADAYRKLESEKADLESRLSLLYEKWETLSFDLESAETDPESK